MSTELTASKEQYPLGRLAAGDRRRVRYVPHDLLEARTFGRALRVHQSKARLGKTLASIEDLLSPQIGRGNLVLFYQPRYSFHSGDVVATEALLRWRAEDGGVLTPDTFLPLVADADAIVPLGRWVLLEACLDAAAWERQRPANATPIIASINIAGKEVLEPRFIEDTRAIIDLSDLPPSLLQLEVNLADPLAHDPAVWSKLQTLRAQGPRVAVDWASERTDFDPRSVDSVHLARGLIDRITDDPTLRPAIEDLIEIAHGAGAQVCATGIEDRHLAETAAAIGCDQIQGYLLGTALESDALGWDDT